MPNVTLLTGNNYTMVLGKYTRTFKRGVQVSNVPVAVAVELAKRKNRKGSPLFLVEEMPTVLEDISHPRMDEAPPVMTQNVTGTHPTPKTEGNQMRFDQWH